MHSIKEDNVQTYPIRSFKIHKEYAFPVVVLSITALFISAVFSLAIPDPLENTIKHDMEENRKPK